MGEHLSDKCGQRGGGGGERGRERVIPCGRRIKSKSASSELHAEAIVSLRWVLDSTWAILSAVGECKFFDVQDQGEIKG